MERAEAVATFPEHQPFGLDSIKKAVKKAGFGYAGAEVVARGQLEASSEDELLLVDPDAEMTLRVVSADDPAAFQELNSALQKGDLSNSVQLRGTVVESEEPDEQAKAVHAQFIIAVTSWQPAADAEIPPVVPQAPNVGGED